MSTEQENTEQENTEQEPGIDHTKTLAPSRVEAWLSTLERLHGPIIGMSQAGAPGGKVRITATTRRTEETKSTVGHDDAG